MKHSVSQKLSFISLKLLLFSVSFHFTKKFLILFHLMKIKSDSVSSHKNKIWFCFISLKKNSVLPYFIKKKSHSVLILTQNRTRSEWEILVLVVSLLVQSGIDFWIAWFWTSLLILIHCLPCHEYWAHIESWTLNSICLFLIM